MTDSSDDSLRVNKHLALQLGISRRQADDLIEAGKVSVNGVTATLGARMSAHDAIVAGGKPVVANASYQYIIMNKPRSYVCSRHQQGIAETVYALLPDNYHHLKPVGRLDKDSSGLLLFTNDGDFAYKMTHPKFYKQKTYLITLNSDLEPLHHQMIDDHGIQLDDGPSKLSLERLSDDDRKQWRVVMSEGRNRQIRRTFASLGYDVKKLHRTHFGNYSLDDIKPGEFEATNIR